MNGKHLFLTSAGLTDKMKEKFFDINWKVSEGCESALYSNSWH